MMLIEPLCEIILALLLFVLVFLNAVLCRGRAWTSPDEKVENAEQVKPFSCFVLYAVYGLGWGS